MAYCSNIATEHCAKNRRCESSRVTPPLREGLTSLSNSFGQKKYNEDFQGVYILWDYAQKNSWIHQN